MSKILIIEDEISFRQALEFILTKEGFEVALAETGPSGISSFETPGP